MIVGHVICVIYQGEFGQRIIDSMLVVAGVFFLFLIFGVIEGLFKQVAWAFSARVK